MIVSVEEMKQYLRVDYPDDDELIEYLIFSAQQLCLDVLRMHEESELEGVHIARIAVMYATAYFYEHREEADHHTLTLMLRALLFGNRQERF